MSWARGLRAHFLLLVSLCDWARDRGFLLLMVLPIAAERLYPLPDRKNHFRDRDKRSSYIAVGCILVSVTGEAVSVCVAVAALIFGVVIPAVIRRKNLWEGLNPL